MNNGRSGPPGGLTVPLDPAPPPYSAVDTAAMSPAPHFHRVDPDIAPMPFLFGFQIPRWTTGQWIGWCIGSLFTLAFLGGVLAALILTVIGDGNRPVKGVCTNFKDMTENTCILAAGQLAFGIFAVGQVTIGVICIGQVNIGLLFCFGQVALSWGFVPFAQLASGTYVRFAQLALTLYKAHLAQLGFNMFWPFIGPHPREGPGVNDNAPSMTTTCKQCGNSNRRRGY